MTTATSNRLRTARAPIAAIVLASVAGILFLLWLIYIHRAPEQFAHRLLFLPALNAIFNGASAIALITGFVFIRRKQVARHRRSMVTAFVFSCLFIASYLTDHALHGDILFAGRGIVRGVYFAILGSHIVLSMVALPLILITFFFALSGRFRQHKRIARITFPIWLYVSVTGVVIFAMLRVWR